MGLKQAMRDFDFSIYDEEGHMFDSEDGVFDLENIHRVPIDIVVYLRNRSEPIFAEHVFFFEKEDPVESLSELMSFAATWWSAITEDNNISYVYFSDMDLNKKAIRIEDVNSISFMTPEKPEWMSDGKHNSDPS